MSRKIEHSCTAKEHNEYVLRHYGSGNIKMPTLKPPAPEPQDVTTGWDPATVNYKPIIYGLLLGIPFWGILGLIVTVVKHYIGGG